MPSRAKDQAPSSELVPHPAKETDFLIETRLSEPDPPFRAPSSWQVTHPQIGADRQWHWSERSTAAFLGFAAGVLIVVPLVIILSMTAEQPLPRATIEVSDAPVATEQAPVKPFIVANVAPATIEVAKDTQATAPAAKPPEAPEAPEAPTLIAQPPTEPKANSAIQEAESQARSALAVGQISEARAALRLAASPDNPQLWFVLAETYDPLITQGSGKSGATSATPADLSDKLTAADIKFAQFYYQQALTHGIAAARDRLAALQKP